MYCIRWNAFLSQSSNQTLIYKSILFVYDCLRFVESSEFWVTLRPRRIRITYTTRISTWNRHRTVHCMLMNVKAIAGSRSRITTRTCVCTFARARRVSARELFYFIMFIQTTTLIRRRWKMNHSSASMSHDKHYGPYVYMRAHIYTRGKNPERIYTTWACGRPRERRKSAADSSERERATLLQGRNFIPRLVDILFLQKPASLHSK